jgi:hypothetical protein
LIIDGAGPRDCWIIGRLRPVRSVRKRGAMRVSTRKRGLLANPLDVGVPALQGRRLSYCPVGARVCSFQNPCNYAGSPFDNEIHDDRRIPGRPHNRRARAALCIAR